MSLDLVSQGVAAFHEAVDLDRPGFPGRDLADPRRGTGAAARFGREAEAVAPDRTAVRLETTGLDKGKPVTFLGALELDVVGAARAAVDRIEGPGDLFAHRKHGFGRQGQGDISAPHQDRLQPIHGVLAGVFIDVVGVVVAAQVVIDNTRRRRRILTALAHREIDPAAVEARRKVPDLPHHTGGSVADVVHPRRHTHVGQPGKLGQEVVGIVRIVDVFEVVGPEVDHVVVRAGVAVLGHDHIRHAAGAAGIHHVGEVDGNTHRGATHHDFNRLGDQTRATHEPRIGDDQASEVEEHAGVVRRGHRIAQDHRVALGRRPFDARIAMLHRREHTEVVQVERDTIVAVSFRNHGVEALVAAVLDNELHLSGDEIPLGIHVPEETLPLGRVGFERHFLPRQRVGRIGEGDGVFVLDDLARLGPGRVSPVDIPLEGYVAVGGIIVRAIVGDRQLGRGGARTGRVAAGDVEFSIGHERSIGAALAVIGGEAEGDPQVSGGIELRWIDRPGAAGRARRRTRIGRQGRIAVVGEGRRIGDNQTHGVGRGTGSVAQIEQVTLGRVFRHLDRPIQVHAQVFKALRDDLAGQRMRGKEHIAVV